MLELTLVLSEFHLCIQPLLLQVELVLLEFQFGVAQNIFLFGQLGLRAENGHAERKVAQRDDHVSLPDDGSFLYVAHLDDSAFGRAEVNGRHRLYLRVDANIVLERAFLGLPDRDRATVHLQRGRVVAGNQPDDECQQQGSQYVRNMLLFESFFLFDSDVHDMRFISLC